MRRWLERRYRFGRQCGRTVPCVRRRNRRAGGFQKYTGFSDSALPPLSDRYPHRVADRLPPPRPRTRSCMTHAPDTSNKIAQNTRWISMLRSFRGGDKVVDTIDTKITPGCGASAMNLGTSSVGRAEVARWAADEGKISLVDFSNRLVGRCLRRS